MNRAWLEIVKRPNFSLKWRTLQRRQSGFKSGGHGSVSKAFRFFQADFKKIVFFQAISQEIGFSRQISEIKSIFSGHFTKEKYFDFRGTNFRMTLFQFI